MALTVGELVAFLGVDDTDFRRTLSQDEQQAQRSASVISGHFRGVSQALGLAVTAAGGLYVALQKVGAGYNILEQNSRAALTAIMDDAASANAQMDKLFAFTKTSPLPKQAYIQAQQTLIGFGVEAAKVVPILKAIDDTTVAIGGNAETVGRLSTVIAQINGLGKITGDTLMQLGSVGIDAASMIADALGKSVEQTRTDISNGLIGADTAIGILTAGMEAKFGGAAANVKAQFTGAADHVKAAWRDLGAALNAPLIDPKGGGRLVDWLEQSGDLIRGLIPVAAELSKQLFTGPSTRGIGGVLRDLTTWVKDLDPQQIAEFVAQAKQIAPVLAGIAAAVVTFGGKQIPVLGSLLGFLNPIAVGLIAVAAASPQMRGALGELLAAGLPLVQALGQLAIAAAQLAAAGVDAGASLLSGMVPPVQAVVALVTPLVQLLALAVHGFASLPQPVLMLAAALTAVAVLRGPLTSLFAKLGDATVLARVRISEMADQIRATPGVFGKMEVAGKSAARGIVGAFGGPWAIGIAAATTGIVLLAQAFADAKKPIVDVNAVVDENTGKLTENANASVAAAFAHQGYLDVAAKAGIAQGDLTKAALGQGDAYDQVVAKLKAYRDEQATASRENMAGLSSYSDAAKQQRNDIRSVMDLLHDLEVQHESVTAAQKAGTAAAAEAAGAQNDTTDALYALDDAQDAAKRTALADADAWANYVVPASEGVTDALRAQIASLTSWLNTASQIRGSITSGLTGFVNPVDAWTQTVQQVQDAARAASAGATQVGKAASTVAKQGHDETVKNLTAMGKAAKAEHDAAVAAAKQAQDQANARAKADTDLAKTAQTNAQIRADAARDEMNQLRKLADLRKGESDDAKKRLDDANFNLQAAQAARAAAQRGLAGASPAEQWQWQQVLTRATNDETAAKDDAARAQADYTDKAQAATDTQAAAEKATKDSTRADKELTAAKQHAADVTEEANTRKTAADAAYEGAKTAADARLQALQDQYEAARDAADARYQAALDAKNAAETASGASTAGYASGVAGAIGDMADKVQPSFDQYLKTLSEQVQAQQDWHDNIITLAQKLPPDVALQLAQLGPQAAPMVQQLVDATDVQLQQWAALWPKSTDKGVQSMVDQMLTFIDPLNRTGAALSQSQIDGFLSRLGSAKTADDVAGIIADLGGIMQNVANGSPIMYPVMLDLTRAQQQQMLYVGDRAYGNEWYGGGRAGGGPIIGPGSSTADKILIRASNDEHMWSAAEVAGAGGHGAVAQMRYLARTGRLGYASQLPRYEAGGPIGGASWTTPTPPPAAGSGPRTQITVIQHNPVTPPPAVVINDGLRVAAAWESVSA